MPKYTINDPAAPWKPTSLRGYITTTYAALVAALGPPEAGVPPKTRAEWFIRWSDGMVATVYDYKAGCPVEDVTDWHVGGACPFALARLEALLRGD